MSQKTKALWKIVKNASLILLVLFGMWFIFHSFSAGQRMYDEKYRKAFEEYDREAAKNR